MAEIDFMQVPHKSMRRRNYHARVNILVFPKARGRAGQET